MPSGESSRSLCPRLGKLTVVLTPRTKPLQLVWPASRFYVQIHPTKCLRGTRASSNKGLNEKEDYYFIAAADERGVFEGIVDKSFYSDGNVIINNAKTQLLSVRLLRSAVGTVHLGLKAEQSKALR